MPALNLRADPPVADLASVCDRLDTLADLLRRLLERDAPAPADELIDSAELRRVTGGMSEAEFFRRRAAGRILRPTAGGKGQRLRWRRSDVAAWIAAGMPTLTEWDRMNRRK